MKKLFILCGILAIAMTACKKVPSDVSKVVKVTYPQITLKGDKYVSLHVGDSYTDPGATLFDDITNNSSDIAATSTTLDPNTPGLYYTLYTAKNANGYVSSAARYIAVTDYDDHIDLSGTYLRTVTGAEPNVTRVARGMYMTDDMGGAGLSDAAYFAMLDDTTIDLGLQYSESIGTEIYGVNGSVIYDGTDTIITYALRAPGYGTQQRTFIKQH